MAREFASINLGIWNDDEFRDLTPGAQHLYFLLLTEPRLSYCGVADWHPKHLMQRAKGWSVHEILDAAVDLLDRRLVLICDDTDEYLIRSFVRHDGVMSHPKLCVSAARAVAATGSNALRQVVIGELVRLKKDRPELPAWGRDEVAEVVKRKHLDGKAVDPFSEPFSPGTREALREAFSQNVSGRLERPYERPYNSNSNTTTKQQQQSGDSSTQPHQGDGPADDNRPPIQPCGERHPSVKDCRACGALADKAKADELSERRAKAAEERAATIATKAAQIAACDLCDDKGYRGGKPCPHEESTPMPAELRGKFKAADK